MFKFFKKTKKQPKDLKEILGVLERLDNDTNQLRKDLEDFKKESRTSFQKIGIIRFSPFKEVGGDQSFCISLLDADNNGFVLTSYYGREMNRVYTKSVKNGKSEYSLSEEEKKAISQATKQKISEQ